METKKFFSKLNKRNYTNQLEEILEKKDFSLDVKNLLLSMLYKINNGYKDYLTVKVEAISEDELMQTLIKTIEEKCINIEFIDPDNPKEVEIDKQNGKILCFPNELSLLKSIWYIAEEKAPIVVKYAYTKEAIQNMLDIGSNISVVEVIRDFNGWSWDIVRKRNRKHKI